MTASRWKKKRRIFAVPWRGQDRFPAFQFREGYPVPVIRKVLEAMPADLTPWQTAFWFVSENGWLEGQRPCDRLDDERALVSAAQREGEQAIG